jgi:DNA-binding SARP family transcriptional activator/tetratricopeptide (TPR) repeat protein
MLALELNQVVSTERLVEAVWGDNPPLTAHAAIQVHISQLRRALADCPRVRIEFCRPGYALYAPEEWVDLFRFRRLVEQAGTAGDEDARRLLGAAVGMWRGRALSDVTTPMIQSQVCPALEEERLLAIEQEIEVGLRLGESRELVSRLARLTAEQPLRERLTVLLMLALWRCGRQADALAEYARMRQRLVTELGVEPGAELRAVHRQVLESDVDTVGTAMPTASVAPVVPRQSLPDVEVFIGRDEPYRQLDTLARDSAVRAKTAVVVGQAGVGKTALVTHWAHRCTEQFPDGQLYVDLRGYAEDGVAISPVDVLGRLLRGLGMPAGELPHEPDEAASAYRSWLAGRRVLVILDNARDPEHVRALLPSSPGCLTVVTSRDQMGGLVASNAVSVIELDVLDHGCAMALLASLLDDVRLRQDITATNELIDLCAGLPLALRIAAAHLVANKALTVRLMVHRLRADLLATLAIGPNSATAVSAAFDISFATLSEPTKRVFSLLGSVGCRDYSPDAVAALAGDGPVSARKCLTELVSAHLLELRWDDRYTFHDLLWHYAADKSRTAVSEPERAGAVRRLVSWYLHSATSAAAQLGARHPTVRPGAPEPGVTVASFPDRDAALRWCDRERVNVIPMVRAAADGDHAETAYQLALVLWGYFSLRSAWTEWIATHEIGAEVAAKLGDARAEARMLANLAPAYNETGRWDDAVEKFERALRTLRGLGETTSVARVVNNLGTLHANRGHAELAASSYRESLDLLDEDRGHDAFRGQVLTNLAQAYRQCGRLDEALDALRAALPLAFAASDDRTVAVAAQAVGEVYADRSSLRLAMRWYERSLRILRQLGDRRNEALCYELIGNAHRDRDEPDSAGQAWLQALAIFAELGDPATEKLRAKIGSIAALVPARREPGRRVAPHSVA